MLEISERCPGCGGRTFDRRRMGLLQCRRCHLVVDRAVWRKDSNAELNDEAFGELYAQSASGWVGLFEHLNNKRTWRRIRPYPAPDATLLEIGVGSGSFLEFARRKGLDVMGCDLSRAICRSVERRTGIAVFHGRVESLAPTRMFDIIVMNHVLEHLNDPVALIQEASRRLRPGGLLHLAVPNYSCFETVLPGCVVYEPYHLIYFTAATLSALLSRADAFTIRVLTHESFSGWFLAITRTLLGTHRTSHAELAKRRVRRQAGPVEHLYRLAMLSAGIVSTPTRRLQSMLGRGDELIALCHARANGKPVR